MAGDYDSKPLRNEELGLLERAGTSSGVRMLLITERPAVERVLDYVVQANTAQMADPAFVTELKSWIRFNGAEAAHKRDGLYSATKGTDALGIRQAAVIGGSAGAPSALQMAIRQEIVKLLYPSGRP